MIRWIRAVDEARGLAGAWVWLVDIQGPEAGRALVGSPARPEDLADAATLRNPEAGARRLLRRRLLRALAARVLDLSVDRLRLGRNADGAPILDGVQLSVAARGDWALLGVAPWPVGVDLERVGAAPACGPGLDPGRAWTAREAYAKAARLGLDAALAIPIHTQDQAATELASPTGRVVAHHHATAELVCAAVMLAAD